MGKQIKIRAFSDWATSFALHDKIIDQFMGVKQLRDTMMFVTDDSYDYAVVFDHKGDNEILTPKERTLGFITEPPDSTHFDRLLSDYCLRVYTCGSAESYGLRGDVRHFPMGVFYHLEGEIEDYMALPPKTHKLGMVLSATSGGFYDYRMNIAKAIATSGMGSVYGRGLNFKGVKGELSNKANGLIPFEFSVCMEGGIWDGYMSDEVLDAVLCSCIPIYVGCSTITTYVPFAIPLVRYDNPKAAIKEIEDILASVKYEEVYPLILSWKKKYLTNYNLYEKIREFICSKQSTL